MTQADYDLLTADEKVGIIRITDEDYVCGVDDVLYGEDGQGQDVTLGDYLDSLVEGHTIKNDSGTSQTQRDNLQFGGVYTHDDSTNNKTKVDIVREFQSVAEIEALTGEAQKGFQVVQDAEDYIPFTASENIFDNTNTSFTGDNVQDVLEEVDERFDSLISEASFTATTNANGVISSTYYSILTNKVILSAICTSEGDSICLLGHNASGNWLKVMNYDLTNISNREVTIKMWYKNLSYNP